MTLSHIIPQCIDDVFFPNFAGGIQHCEKDNAKYAEYTDRYALPWELPGKFFHTFAGGHSLIDQPG